jgi:glycine/D-amino acid oxidase-like deaminating enzyme
MRLTPATSQLVRDEIVRTLQTLGGTLEGWTSLAVGADQIFARAILEVGGSLVFVNPSRDIESTIPPANLSEFRALRSVARELSPVFDLASDEAFWAAGKRIAESVDVLVVVWDGKDPAGLGGTADVVKYRKQLGLPWVHIWPSGSSRD